MKQLLAVIAALSLIVVLPTAAAAEVPSWIKNNAGWWADGTISESEFVQGIQHLIKENILKVPQTQVSSEKTTGVPVWVKNNAGWWADGTISDKEFLNGIQHLIKLGIIDIPSAEKVTEKPLSNNSESLQAQLDACQEIKKAYQRLDCEKPIKLEMKKIEFVERSTAYVAGPVTFYFPGVGSLGNSG